MPLGFTYEEFVNKYKDACPMPPSEPPPPPSPPMLGFTPIVGEEWINVDIPPAPVSELPPPPPPPIEVDVKANGEAPVIFKYNGSEIMFYPLSNSGVQYSVDNVARPIFYEAFFGKDKEGVYLRLSSINKLVPIPGRNTPELVRMLVAMFDKNGVKHNLFVERAPTPPPPAEAILDTAPKTLVSDAVDLERQLMERALPPTTNEKSDGAEASHILTNLLLSIGEKNSQPRVEPTKEANAPGPSPIFEDLKKLGLYTPSTTEASSTPSAVAKPSKETENTDKETDKITNATKAAGSRALQRARQMESLYSYEPAKPEEQVREIIQKDHPTRAGSKGYKGDKGGGKRGGRGGKSRDPYREDYLNGHTEKVKVGKVGGHQSAGGYRRPHK